MQIYKTCTKMIDAILKYIYMWGIILGSIIFMIGVQIYATLFAIALGVYCICYLVYSTIKFVIDITFSESE